MPNVTQLGSASVRTQTQVSGPSALPFSYFTVLLRAPCYAFICLKVKCQHHKELKRTAGFNLTPTYTDTLSPVSWPKGH